MGMFTVKCGGAMCGIMLRIVFRIKLFCRMMGKVLYIRSHIKLPL